MNLKPKMIHNYSSAKMKYSYMKPSSKYSLNNVKKNFRMELIGENMTSASALTTLEEPTTITTTTTLKRSISSSDEDQIKKQKLNHLVLKNSIQQLYEIKLIQPIEFDMLSSEGPQHKPTFKFCLKFKLNENQLKFYGEGLSKKAAKTVASMKALLYLSETQGSFDKEYFKSLISYDMKQLNVNEPYETYLENLKRPELTPNQEAITIDIENETRKETSTKSIIESIHDSDMISVESTQTTIEIKPIKKTTYDLKTREIIATKMPMSIFNHMLASVQSYSFNLISETGMSHSKMFKMELKIDKNAFTDGSLFTIVDINSLKSNDSLLFTETQTEYLFTGFGSSLKMAKSRAAQLALDILFDIKITSPESEEIIPVNNTELLDSELKIKEFADNISELAKNKFNNLLSVIEARAAKSNALLSNLTSIFDEEIASSKKLRNVYAAIIQSTGFDYNTSKLICVTTGTKCINGEYMSQMGTSINDCHAEILAVRLLRKYIYKQLNDYISYLNTNPYDKSCDNLIFELAQDESNNNDQCKPTKPFRLKQNVKFHLYISSAPCGDGRIFSIHDNVPPDNHPNRKIRGLLRTKLESGEGTVPLSNTVEIQTWDGILIGERLKVMSCSDKLCKYNVVGIQGALLSHFVETIYLNSVIVGGYYHRYHLSRALYGRICESLTELPLGFRLNLPILSSITNNEQRKVAKSSSRSVIWSHELNKLNENFEIINCKEGKSIDGTPSLVCKYELFKDWYSLWKSFKTSRYLGENNTLNNYLKLNENPSLVTYSQVKLLATDYQLAKLKVYDAFKKANLGNWLTKPFEQNYFSLTSEFNFQNKEFLN